MMNPDSSLIRFYSYNVLTSEVVLFPVSVIQYSSTGGEPELKLR